MVWTEWGIKVNTVLNLICVFSVTKWRKFDFSSSIEKQIFELSTNDWSSEHSKVDHLRVIKTLCLLLSNVDLLQMWVTILSLPIPKQFLNKKLQSNVASVSVTKINCPSRIWWWLNGSWRHWPKRKPLKWMTSTVWRRAMIFIQILISFHGEYWRFWKPNQRMKYEWFQRSIRVPTNMSKLSTTSRQIIGKHSLRRCFKWPCQN